LEAIETGEAEEIYSSEEGEKICRFLALLAKVGAIADTDEEKAELERDIEKLLHGERGLLPCRSWIKKVWDETKEFVHDHKTGVIIGAAILLTGGAIVYAITAGAAAAIDHCTPQEPERPISRPLLLPPVEPIATSSFQEAVQERISSFKEELCAEKSSRGPLSREVACLLAHETFDAIAELGAIIHHFRDAVVQASALVADEIERSFGISLFNANDLSISPSPVNAVEQYDHVIAKGHEKLDELFSSSFASRYTPETKAKNPFNDFDLGILPPPNNLLGGMSSARKILQAGQGTAILAEELGFTSREIIQLEKSGTLEVAVEDAFGNLVRDPANLRSWERFKKVEEFLKPYQGHTFSSEVEIRALIRQTGIETFPRPKGIPENYRITLAEKSGGIKYVHPRDTGTYIRIMPGKSHSPFLHQREPYVNQRINGRSIDKSGNTVPNNSPEAHIKINEFVYRE
jgi:hypothetical protein